MNNFSENNDPKDCESIEENKLLSIAERGCGINDENSETKKELIALKDKYARLGADFENYKKRSINERNSAIKFANETLLKEVLPILDHFETALTSFDNENCDLEISGNVKSLVSGIKLTFKQFVDSLSKFGLNSFVSLGKSFDPKLHEALFDEEDDSVLEGTIIKEIQKGYILNDRLLRASMVTISKKSKS